MKAILKEGLRIPRFNIPENALICVYRSEFVPFSQRECDLHGKGRATSRSQAASGVEAQKVIQ